MIATDQNIDKTIDDLLEVLDTDSRLIQQSLLRLDEMRSLVIRRDEQGLSRLLDTIQAEAAEYQRNESRRTTLRRKIADAFAGDPKQVTLSWLQSVLPPTKSSLLAERKTTLKALTDSLKTEYAKAAMLLADCARFNRLLLTSIIEFGRTHACTYNPDGSAKTQSSAGLVNLQF
jgi:transposase